MANTLAVLLLLDLVVVLDDLDLDDLLKIVVVEIGRCVGLRDGLRVGFLVGFQVQGIKPIGPDGKRVGLVVGSIVLQ